MTHCSVQGCSKPAGTAKGLCVMHYQRLKRHGHTNRKFAPLAERFWESVDMSQGPNACWPWQKFRDKPMGYGVVSYNGKPRRAHRIAWTIRRGPTPEGIDVLHRCDNPPCCNPKHLWLGTDLDNRRDCLAKGRARFARGEDSGATKITAKQALTIRRRYAKGGISQQKLGDLFGINQRAISAIILRKSWKHV